MADLSLTTSTRFATRTRRSFALMDYIALWRQRSALARMDERQLRDLGLTREEAMSEAERPVWDVPANWKR